MNGLRSPFAGAEILRTVPTTEPQREIWLSIAVGGDQASLAYNESLSAHLQGAVDPGAIASAVAALIERHDALRSTFSGDGQQLIVNATSPTTLRVHDLRELDAAARESGRLQVIDARMRSPFDLRDGPLFHADLLLLTTDRSELVLTAHHLVCDGWSIGVLLSELPELVDAARERRVARLPPAPSFADYAVAQREGLHGSAAVAAERFWIDALGVTPTPIELPTDRARGAVMMAATDGVCVRDLAAAREDVRLEPELVAGLERVAKQQRASVAAVLFAGFAALLHRLSGQRRFAVGMPWAGQADSGQHGLVGHCVNTLPVPVQLDPEAPFAAMVVAAKRALLDCGEHQRLSFGNLLAKLTVPRDPGRVPLIPVVFNLDQELAGARVGDAHATFFTNARVAENFELFVNATPAAGALVLETSYSTRLFERATILRWAGELRELLAGVVADVDTPVARLPLLTAADRDLLARAATGGPLQEPEPAAPTTLDLIEASVRAAPDAVVVIGDDGTLTYRELDRRANHLAMRLVAAGAAPGEHVGICLERGVGLVVAVLAVWKAGCAYAPLDPGYPERRLEIVAADTAMRLVVCTPELDRVLAGRDVQRVHLDRGVADAPPDRSRSADAIAYVLHTSGSTGRPKGVAVDHRALRNHVLGVVQRPGMDAHTVLAAVVTLSFDLACFELFAPLVAGGRVVVVPAAAVGDGVELGRRIATHGANMLQATPSTFRLLLDAGFTGGQQFTAVNGGEALTSDLVRALLPRVGRYWNGYGPTEATVHACVARIESAEPPYPIGRPLPNYTAYVLDDHGQQVPPGVVGELYLGGISVARGYLGQPELTAERFVRDPFASVAGARLYRTGDFAWVGADGQLFFCGRRDGQVKVRGYRIELGEVEAALASAPGVSAAAATVHSLAPGDDRLCAYYVASADVDETVGAHLRRALPPQMVPQHVQRLAALPMTPNGKIDRKALPRPDGTSRDGYVAPSTEVQIAMAAIWAELLRVERIGIRDNFFETGGHSMLAARLTTRCRERFGVDLPLRVVFQAQTIEALSAVLEAALVHAPDGCVRPPGREEVEF